MIRPLTLLLALAAPAAQACAVAEGCPMGEPPAGCATVRIDADHLCMDDPSAPGGFVIVPRGGIVPADAPDCGVQGQDGCARPVPGGSSLAPAGQAIGAGLAAPVVGLLVLLGVAASR